VVQTRSIARIKHREYQGLASSERHRLNLRKLLQNFSSRQVRKKAGQI
jgi:hypothetical protein